MGHGADGLTQRVAALRRSSRLHRSLKFNFVAPFDPRSSDDAAASVPFARGGSDAAAPHSALSRVHRTPSVPLVPTQQRKITVTDNTTPLPSDEPTVAELAAAGAIRPLDQLPSPWTVKGEPAILSQPTLDALSGADQKVVLERAGSNHPDAISKALDGFLRERQREFRIRCGPGEGATATEREALDQMNQLRLLTEEAHRIKAELVDVREHRTEYDENGQPKPVPVYTIQGSLRSAKQSRLEEIGEYWALIAGVQGEAALARATREDALRARALAAQADDLREIERRAQEMVREERLNAAASQKAKFLKGNVG